jgi:DNA polymerase III subunit delta'
MNILWHDIINQKNVQSKLLKIFKNNFYPPALLFTGEEGSGKEASAFAFAQSINCITNSFYPCGNCKACKSVSSFELPYLKFIYPMPLGKNETSGDDPFLKLKEETLEEISIELQKKKSIHIIN